MSLSYEKHLLSLHCLKLWLWESEAEELPGYNEYERRGLISMLEK